MDDMFRMLCGELISYEHFYRYVRLLLVHGALIHPLLPRLAGVRVPVLLQAGALVAFRCRGRWMPNELFRMMVGLLI